MTAFEQFRPKGWPYRFEARLLVNHLHGGIPTDPKVAEAFLRSKIQAKDDLIKEMVAETMMERDVTADEALDLVGELRYLNGFKRDAEHGLYIEGRQVKAALKEAASVARATGKLGKRWGETNKGIISFAAEHIFVEEERVFLGVAEPDGIDQGFVSSSGPQGRRQSIRYNEFVQEAKLVFHVLSDFEFAEQDWAMIWLTGEKQGLGANRSMGYGTYHVESWEEVGYPS